MLKQVNSKFNLQCLQRAYSTGAEVDLKAVMAKKIPDYQNMVKKFRKEHGNDKIMEVTVNMMYGGMRGIKSMIYETSDLDPEQGIRFRGFSIPECQEKLPKAKNGNQPLPEAIFWLLLTSDIPNEEQVSFVTKEWNKRSCLPEYVVEMINNFPKELHPMAQVAAALTVCNLDSKFKEAYEKGVSKNQYWEFIYEDAMNLIPRLSIISALVYRNKYKDGILGEFNEKFDFAKNLNAMMGFNREEFDELMRMYLTIHCDHEGGNVSAHTTHLVGSALSDPYLAYAAGLNGLAGPLHGLANQEVLNWLRKVEKELGDNFTEKQLKDFIWKTLKSGQVIPGFGHAVLRRTDPRYTCQRLFAQKYLPEFPLFKLTDQLYRIVPPILKELGKVANPWPNVDAHSGVLLVHYGLTELTFYTVLFGISRAIGCMSALVWSRALGFPIERPKSISTPLLMKSILKSGKTKQSRSFESVSKVL